MTAALIQLSQRRADWCTLAAGTSPTRCVLFHGALLALIALAISKRAQCRPLQYPDQVHSTKVRESGKEVWRLGAGESFAGHMF